MFASLNAKAAGLCTSGPIYNVLNEYSGCLINSGGVSSIQSASSLSEHDCINYCNRISTAKTRTAGGLLKKLELDAAFIESITQVESSSEAPATQNSALD
jgi:hypothetical protein